MRPAAARGRASVIPNICAPDAPPWQALREGRRRAKGKDVHGRECAAKAGSGTWAVEPEARAEAARGIMCSCLSSARDSSSAEEKALEWALVACGSARTAARERGFHWGTGCVWYILGEPVQNRVKILNWVNWVHWGTG